MHTDCTYALVRYLWNLSLHLSSTEVHAVGVAPIGSPHITAVSWPLLRLTGRAIDVRCCQCGCQSLPLMCLPLQQCSLKGTVAFTTKIAAAAGPLHSCRSVTDNSVAPFCFVPFSPQQPRCVKRFKDGGAKVYSLETLPLFPHTFVPNGHERLLSNRARTRERYMESTALS